jgi:cysteine-rich repeat protein
VDDRLVNSERTAVACSLAACDPRQPYRVAGGTVRFLEAEPQQNEDLNHDGDTTDLVVQVLNVRSGVVASAGAVQPDDPAAAAPGPDPLDPIDSGGDGSGAGAGGGTVFVADGRCIETKATACSTAADCETGESCGGGGTCQRDHGTCASDADCPAGVATCESALYTAAAADADGDLVPDPLDNCPRKENADQADADADGVGNACDLETCGNTVVELDEECDDGNTANGDGCSPACRVESGPCDDGNDNDGDGLVDFGLDPACKTAAWTTESTQCQDGLNNDGQLGIDFDGGASMNGGVPLDFADPQCLGQPSRNLEKAQSCGLGVELVAPLALLLGWRRRRHPIPVPVEIETGAPSPA